MRDLLCCDDDGASRYEVRLASPEDRETIYRIRHDVYAGELGQHCCNAERTLRDALDEFNEYIVVARGESLSGFIAITPPNGPQYSLDKYLDRTQWPFAVDAGLYEVRLLTVVPSCRSGPTAMLLMHAAQRYLEEQRATRAIAIGRREVLSLYLRVGFQRLGPSFLSGAVRYDLLCVEVRDIAERTRRFQRTLRQLAPRVHWTLNGSYLSREPDREPLATSEDLCPHGGAFFEQIGIGFETLDRRHAVINADVLDAWFPPAPAVTAELQVHLDWVLRTSPPVDCAGLIHQVATSRAVPAECLLPGAGSSDLIYRALPRWLTPGSRVLLLDPTYGEYRHVLQRVIGCRIETFALSPEDGFAVDIDKLARQLEEGYDLIVIVNPNNPTGTCIPREALADLLERVRPQTRIWIDEAYIDYVDPGASMEGHVAATRNAVVCKSLSKAYALSGARAAYLCGSPELLADLRSLTPPWVIGLPAQIAATVALRNADYYRDRYAQTRQLRVALGERLEDLGLLVWPGTANFLLCRLPERAGDVATLSARCREHGLFIRDVASMTARPDRRLFRLAVKDAQTNARMVNILSEVLTRPPIDAMAPTAIINC